MFGASVATLKAILLFVAESALSDIQLQIAVQDAVTKAFASKHPQTRRAYIDLATFFEAELAKKHGAAAVQLALLTRYSTKPSSRF
jgi:hypothetical protein